jgi:hypothetical protein
LCPWCGLPTPDRQHAGSGDCIRALEAEIVELKKLLSLVRRPALMDEQKEYA